MKTFLLGLVFLASFALEQEELSVEKDSVYILKFDLGLEIKHWDNEPYEEKQKKRQQCEQLDFPS